MPDAPATFRWREPTVALTLRWGGYRTRLLGGLLLIVAGGLAVAGGGVSSPFATALLYAGSVAHITGWSILPSAGWRRVWALIPSTTVMWALLAGPGWLWILVFPYLGWLLVRHRPLASYPTLLFVIAGAVLVAPLFPSYSLMLPALGTMATIMMLSALAARAVHVAQARGRDVRRRRKLRKSAASAP
ncbi:hypothetical protein [Pseudolysinimonas sp.]|uniref:hypothetical protein n=1 Tax=Pseudolysinimonas sp. TaxID=2680009 RepID=UPI00286A4B41|nr:hypothetical protein [Pseudolysinimonas sp.]